ncbi:MAG: TonB-dependent receptor [Pseudomonadota bacterium]
MNISNAHRSALLAALFLGNGLGANAQAPSATAVDHEIDEIVVRGVFVEADRVTGSAHRVDAQTLELYEYNDISRVLNFVPGVYVREEDGVGLRPNIGLRGGSADRSQKVMLMEDGVPLSPAPYSAPAAYYFPLTTRMVGVEVIKGPASIQHGPQTIGGAINLVSAPIPDATETMLQLSGGNFGHRLAHGRAGTQFDKVGLLGEFVHLGSDGFKDIDGGGDAGFEKNELLLKSSFAIGRGELELRLSYANEVSNETYLGLTEADLREDPFRRYRASVLDRMEWDWAAGRIDWRHPLLGGQLNVTGYYQYFDRAWRKFNNFNGADIREVLANPQTPFNQLFVSILDGADTDGVSGSPDDIRVGTNDRNFYSTGLQSGLQWFFGRRATHALEMGLRVHADRVRRLHDEFGFEQIDRELLENDQPRDIVTDNTGQTQALSLWIRDEINVGRWRVVPGLRIEAISNTFTDRLAGGEQDNEYLVALPGLGAAFDVTDGLMMLVGVHRGFSPATPSLTEDIEPEDSWNYEAGARWRGPLGKVEVIGFFNDYNNLTAICTISAGCLPEEIGTQTNAGEVRTFGVEAGWSKSFRVSSGLSVPFAASYTYTNAEFREEFQSSNPQFGSVEPGFNLPYVPPHRANVNAGVEGANWGLQLSFAYISRMRDQAGMGPIPPDEGSDETTYVDLAAYYEVSKRFRLAGRVDNVTDEVYVVSRRPFGARPGRPRMFQLSATYRY